MSTWPEDHKRIAAGALNTLPEARTLSRDAALARLQPLRRKMQNDHPDDLIERANAWLAVCRLCVELPQSDNDELPPFGRMLSRKRPLGLMPCNRPSGSNLPSLVSLFDHLVGAAGYFCVRSPAGTRTVNTE